VAIEGLRFEVEATELKKHLLKMSKYHEEEAAERRRWETQRERTSPAQGAENSGKDGGKNREWDMVKYHEMTATFFRFLADHVIEDETYRLTRKDLKAVEMVEEYTLARANADRE
jgi:hypothetical protein